MTKRDARESRLLSTYSNPKSVSCISSVESKISTEASFLQAEEMASNDITVFRPTNPHFFKVILGDRRLDRYIPKKFAYHFGDRLSNKLTLRVPTGDVWEVEIQRGQALELLMITGWTGFLEFYSVEPGYFVLFKYERDSELSVSIFDKTTLEIDYRVKNRNILVEPKEKTEDELGPVQLLGESSRRKKLGKTPLRTGSSTRGMRVARAGGNACRSVEMRGTNLGESSRSKELGKTPLRTGSSSRGMRVAGASRSTRRAVEKRSASVKPLRTPDLSEMDVDVESSNQQARHSTASSWKKLERSEKRAALKIAKALFESRNPHFMIVVQPSYLPPRCKVNLSSKFSKKFLKGNKGDMILIDRDGNRWEASYFAEDGLGKWAMKMVKGWSGFAHHKELEVGDVCIFEYLPGCTEITLKVTVCRAGRDAALV